MTLIGAINGNRKILFADRKWALSHEGKKIFEHKNGMIAVSGIITNSFVKHIQTEENIEELIIKEYNQILHLGTSFINYDFKTEDFTSYVITPKSILSGSIENYMFFGYNAKDLIKSYQYPDENSLKTSIHSLSKKYSEFIGNKYDFYIIENKTMIHNIISFY